VPTNVVTAAIMEVGLWRRTNVRLSTLTDPIAAEMRTAASVGNATPPTAPANATRIASIQSPEKIAAHLVRAPAVTFKAVCPTDPPTGCPRTRPEATLPSP
jgi:hypothetical protein